MHLEFLLPFVQARSTTLAPASNPTITKVKGWVKTNIESERERQDGVLAALKEQAEGLSRETKATETKCNRAEKRVSMLHKEKSEAS